MQADNPEEQGGNPGEPADTEAEVRADNLAELAEPEVRADNLAELAEPEVQADNPEEPADTEAEVQDGNPGEPAAEASREESCKQERSVP